MKKYLLGSSFACLCLVAPALAQQEPAEVVKLDPVIVTAQQREQRLVDVPISINVLNSADVKARGLQNLQDVAFAVPEMINVVTGMAQNRVMLRGIGEGGGNFPLVGIYLDEVAVDGPLRGPLEIRPLDVERIEVLNGPQGTLYGQGSVGGTVRFLTNAPVLGETSLLGSADISNTDDGSLSQSYTAVVNLPVGNRAALRIAGIAEDTGGWIDAPTAGRKDINDGEMYQVRAKGLVQVTGNFSLTGVAQIHRNDVGSLSNGENADGNLILPAFAPGAVQPASNDHEMYSLTANLDLGGAELLAVASQISNDSKGAFYSPFAGQGRFLRFDNQDEAQSGELRLTSADTGPWHWTLGAFYRDADYSSVTTLYLLGPANGTTAASVNFVTNAPIQSKSWSVYGNTSFDLTDKLQVGAGLRHFSDDEKAPIAGRPGATFESLDPRVFATYKLRDNWTIYASASKGFRSGGFNAANPAFPPSFKPETVWSYEAGTKFDLLDGVISGEVAAFSSDYSDMQVSTIATSIGQSYTGNVGEAEINGLDWTFRALPVEWLEIGTSGAVLDSEVVDIAPRSAYIVGDSLNYIPRNNITLYGEASTDIGSDLRARFRLDFNRRGGSEFAQRTVNLTATSETLKLLNARLMLEHGNFVVEIYGKNLLNDRGEVFPNPVQFAVRAVPRTVGIRTTISF